MSSNPHDALGALVATHAHSTAEERAQLWPAIAIVVAGVLLVLMHVDFGYLMIIGGTVAALFVGAKLGWAAKRFGGSIIERRERGLVVRRPGKSDRAVTWDEIGPMYSRKYRWQRLERKPSAAIAVSPWFALTAGDAIAKNLWFHRVEIGGESLVLDRHWNDVAELVSAIREQRRLVHLPEAKRKIDAGQPVELGPITFTASTIMVRAASLEWSKVAKLAFEQAQVVVYRKPTGRFASVDCHMVPDHEIAVDLAAWILTRRDGYR